MLINELDNNPFRLDARLLEDAGMARVGDAIVAIRDSESQPVVAKMGWLQRLVDSLRPRAAYRFSF